MGMPALRMAAHILRLLHRITLYVSKPAIFAGPWAFRDACDFQVPL